MLHICYGVCTIPVGNSDLMGLTMKNTVILPMSLLFFALAGCTNSFAKVEKSIEDAPEWYSDKRSELVGEGYPEVADAPRLTDENRPGQTLQQTRTDIEAAKKIFLTNERAESPSMTPAQIRKAAAQFRRDVDVKLPAGDFMTNAEIAAIRAKFAKYEK